MVRVLNASFLQLTPTPATARALRPFTDLLPPEWLPPLDEDRLVREARAWVEQHPGPVSVPKQSPFLTSLTTRPGTDAEYVETFPPRTNTDLSIRRTRLADVFNLYKIAGRGDEWALWLPRLANLDYITVQNLLYAQYIHSILPLFHASGALSSVETFSGVASLLNNLLKKFPAPMALRLRFCEAAGLTGYRNPPFPGFDRRREAEVLAHGGTERPLGDGWLTKFTDTASSIVSFGLPKPVPFKTLAVWVADGSWLTAGSSSIGKVEWTYDGEKGHFKARKNFLFELYSPAQLVAVAEAATKQKNVTLLKSELGKLRLAVAGDLGTYLLQSYLDYLCGDVYLQWPGNTLQENFAAQTERMTNMLKELRHQYSLPFDFSAFDHQPTLPEIRVLVRLYFLRGSANVPVGFRAAWRAQVDRAVDAFLDATLSDTDNGSVALFKVLGGLMSGLRVTTLVGNLWNQTMTQIAKDFLTSWGIVPPSSFLRGDDSSLMSPNYYTCLAMRLAYQSINAKGTDGKFGIHKGQTEFLRVWYADGQTYGFPNRAIPSLSQRKPWSSDPWTPSHVVSALTSTLHTLQRRLGREIPHLGGMISRAWSKQTRLSDRWLGVPAFAGGLGLYPDVGWRPSAILPSTPTVPINFSNLSPSLATTFAARFSFPLTEHQATELAVDAARKKLASDDVRGVMHLFRDSWKQGLPSEVVWTRRKVEVPTDVLPTLAVLQARVRSLTPTHYSLDLSLPRSTYSFGLFRPDQQRWRDSVALSRLDGERPLDRMSFSFRVALAKLEAKGLHRTAALSWLFGDLEGLTPGAYNSQLEQERITATALCMADVLKRPGYLSRSVYADALSRCSQLLADDLYSSPLSTYLYRF